MTPAEIKVKTGISEDDLEYMFDPPSAGRAMVEQVKIPFEKGAGVDTSDFEITDIKDVVAGWSGCNCEHDGGEACGGWCDDHFFLLGELNDGRFFYISAWNDSSGWG